MEKEGRLYISPQYTREDYLRLRLNINSSEEIWHKAVNIFDDRIRGRFINSIEVFCEDVSNSGFSIMAINCLLVDTLSHFILGKTSTTKIDYVKCLLYIFDQEFSLGDPGGFLNHIYQPEPRLLNLSTQWEDYWGMMFYKDIRCGILHAAQTQNGSRLTAYQDRMVSITDKGKLSVDVSRFTRLLKQFYIGYINDLQSGKDNVQRSKFIKQMKYICRFEDGWL